MYPLLLLHVLYVMCLDSNMVQAYSNIIIANPVVVCDFNAHCDLLSFFNVSQYGSGYLLYYKKKKKKLCVYCEFYVFLVLII